MHYIVLALLLPALVLADAQSETYSFSQAVGTGYGISFRLTGIGKINALRVWEVQSNHYYHYRYYSYHYFNYHNYISGIQICYDNTWSPIIGYGYYKYQEIVLRPGEVIIAVAGKYTHFINSLVFTTSLGRSLFVGQPTGRSFNMYPEHPLAELRSISGRFTGGLTSFQTHWGMPGAPAAQLSDGTALA